MKSDEGLIGAGPDGNVLVIGAHHIEPALEPDVGYTEVVAVSRQARGTLLRLPEGREADELNQRHFQREQQDGPTGAVAWQKRNRIKRSS